MIEVLNRSRQDTPDLPWVEIMNKILGPDYTLSLVFIGDKTSRKLNRAWRKKDRPTNVLAFPLEKNSGEIFLNLKKTKTEAGRFDRSEIEHIGALFIHALLHLKGYEHGSIMEKQEKKFKQYFNFNGQTHKDRFRHRNHFGSSGGV